MRHNQKAQQNCDPNEVQRNKKKFDSSNDLDYVDEESSDSEDEVENKEEKLKNDSLSSNNASNQFVEFVVQNGSWTMNTGNIPDDAYQRREVNGLRYMISVSDGKTVLPFELHSR